jgi:hypothetical protein
VVAICLRQFEYNTAAIRWKSASAMLGAFSVFGKTATSR